jgi:hypothetical protein
LSRRLFFTSGPCRPGRPHTRTAGAYPSFQFRPRPASQAADFHPERRSAAVRPAPPGRHGYADNRGRLPTVQQWPLISVTTHSIPLSERKKNGARSRKRSPIGRCFLDRAPEAGINALDALPGIQCLRHALDGFQVTLPEFSGLCSFARRCSARPSGMVLGDPSPTRFHVRSQIVPNHKSSLTRHSDPSLMRVIVPDNRKPQFCANISIR